MLMQGNYGSVDWNEAYNWLTKAHEMGSSQGTLYLHLLYIAKGKLATGLNPYYDLKKGFLYLELAAQKGNNSAQDWLASIYERGYGAEQYIPVDKAKGAAWRVLSLKSKKNEVKLIGNTYTIDEFLKSHAPFDETLKKFKPLSPEEIAKARELINEYSELYKI